jgi:hypothetical protein
MHGTFPANLGVLTQPEAGKSAALEEKDLVDPWGNQFTYNPGDLSATGRPLISTTAPSGVTISNR